MRKRETPRLIPERANVLLVSIGDRELHFRVPSPLKSSELMAALDTEQIMTLASIAGDIEGMDAAAVFDMVRTSGPGLLKVVGCIVGMAWFAVDSDLDATQKAYPDLLEYGAAVYDELDLEGFDMTMIFLLTIKLGQEMAAGATVDKEASERLGFSKLPRVNGTSSSSTSASTSSGTPGAIAN